MGVELPPQSVYDHTTSAVIKSRETGKPIQLSLEDLAKVADLHQEGPNEKGPVFKFKDKNNVEHSLSVKDFEVAGGIFKGMDLQKVSDTQATVVVGDNMDQVLASLPSGTSGKLGKTAKTPDDAAKGDLGYRLIKVSDGDPIKVYGKVSPKAEALIADGWLSDNDMHELQKGNKGWEYSADGRDIGKDRASRMMSLLYQRQVDHAGTVFGGKNYSGGHFSAQDKTDQQHTYQAMVAPGGKYTTNAFVGDGPGAKGKFEQHLINFGPPAKTAPASTTGKPTASAPSKPLTVSRAEHAKIDASPTIAPEDKAYLKQMVFLKYIAQFPSDTDGSRPNDMADLPNMAEVNDALLEMGFDPAKSGIKTGPKEASVLDQMLNRPEKFTLVLQQLAARLGIPTEK